MRKRLARVDERGVRMKVVPLVAGLCIALAGCSTNPNAGQGPRSGGENTVIDTSKDSLSDEARRALEERIDRATGVPEWIPPGPAFDASEARGKTVFSITLGSQIDFCNALDKTQKAIAEDMGINYVEFPNQSEQSQWVQGFNQAIARNVDVILLSCAPNAQVLQPQIAAAERAGIPVVQSPASEPFICQEDRTYRSERYPDMPACFLEENGVPAPDTTANLAAWADGPYPIAARLMADVAILETNGNLNALIVNSSDIYTADPLAGAMEAEMDAWCPDTCSATVVDVPTPQWATKIQSSVENAVKSDSSINYILPLYDAMNANVIPALRSTGSDAKITSFNGSIAALQQVSDSDHVSANLGENLEWKGYAAMDMIMRLLAGEPPVEDYPTPVRLWTKENIDEAGTPPTFFDGYGTEYKSGYESLWTQE